MHTNKRRPNNMNNGSNGGQQNRHNNNRPRRFGGSNNNRQHGGDDSANIARTRRNAMQSREKYQNMARDAMSMGDRVMAENYLQHADHYYRVLMALPPEEVRQPYHQRTDNNMSPEGEQQSLNGGSEVVSSASHNEPVQNGHMQHADNLPQENLPE